MTEIDNYLEQTRYLQGMRSAMHTQLMFREIVTAKQGKEFSRCEIEREGDCKGKTFKWN